NGRRQWSTRAACTIVESRRRHSGPSLVHLDRKSWCTLDAFARSRNALRRAARVAHVLWRAGTEPAWTLVTAWPNRGRRALDDSAAALPRAADARPSCRGTKR